MTSTDHDLRPRETRVVAALLTERTLAGAAQAAGVGEKTIRRWLKRPDFASALRDAQAEAVGDALGRLRAVTGEAVQTLRDLAVSANSESVRLGAARSILDFALRATELDDLAERIQLLEQAAVEGQGRPLQ